MQTTQEEVPYGKHFTLLKPLDNVECWNSSNGNTGSFQPGEVILLQGVYDATHTTILCAEKDGRPLTAKDGQPATYRPTPKSDLYPIHGYRFIVPNQMLGEAIGIRMPERTRDLVGELMAYESGEMSDEKADEFLEHLRDTGIGQKLQGHYSSRM